MKRAMEVIGKAALGILAGLILAVTVQAAVSAYPRLRASALEFFTSTGTKRWSWQLDSSNNLDLYENSNINGQVASFATATGGFIMRSRTSTQISTLSPSVAGEIIWNSSRNTPCVSTGTTGGAWIPIQLPDSTKINCYF